MIAVMLILSFLDFVADGYQLWRAVLILHSECAFVCCMVLAFLLFFAWVGLSACDPVMFCVPVAFLLLFVGCASGQNMTVVVTQADPVTIVLNFLVLSLVGVCMCICWCQQYDMYFSDDPPRKQDKV